MKPFYRTEWRDATSRAAAGWYALVTFASGKCSGEMAYGPHSDGLAAKRTGAEVVNTLIAA